MAQQREADALVALRHASATTIQAAWRGHSVRQSISLGLAGEFQLAIAGEFQLVTDAKG
jgi:hypothetical protein